MFRASRQKIKARQKRRNKKINQGKETGREWKNIEGEEKVEREKGGWGEKAEKGWKVDGGGGESKEGTK